MKRFPWVVKVFVCTLPKGYYPLHPSLSPILRIS
jgi:hypothetical protein